jgi:hypothetical protein
MRGIRRAASERVVTNHRRNFVCREHDDGYRQPEPGSERLLDLSEDCATSARRGRKNDVAAVEQSANILEPKTLE